MPEAQAAPRKSVRIEYQLREDVDLAGFKTSLQDFVAAMKAHSCDHQYTSYQSEREPRRFVHLGSFEAPAIPAMQASPFFQRFSALLRASCEEGPSVTSLQQIASTR